MKFATRSIHAGNEPRKSRRSIMPPIYLSSTFLQDFPGEETEYSYTRAGNPNFTILETLVASLEGGKYATAFSSGLGTLTAMVSTLNQGDRVIGIGGIYGGTFRFFYSVFSKFGIEFTIIPSASKEHIEKGLALNPKWILFETPTNPLLESFDIAKLTETAKEKGILTIVDNTFATPCFQTPLALGADIVWHSCTKYLGGHSDAFAGLAVTNDAKIKRELDFARMALGVNPSPFDAWLVTRGIKTLALRMERHEKNATSLATALEKHPMVKRVYYPGLPTHPTYEAAKKNMTGFGGVLSVEFDLKEKKAKEMISTYKIFALAESLGGVESLVCHPATMSHASIPQVLRNKCGITDSLIRYSVGIEDPDDLLEDILQALQRIKTK